VERFEGYVALGSRKSGPMLFDGWDHKPVEFLKRPSPEKANENLQKQKQA
jgi:hypothetical protein